MTDQAVKREQFKRVLADMSSGFDADPAKKATAVQLKLEDVEVHVRSILAILKREDSLPVVRFVETFDTCTYSYNGRIASFTGRRDDTAHDLIMANFDHVMDTIGAPHA